MIPDMTLSSVPITGPFQYPRNLPVSDLESWSMGGVALNDSSQGLQVKAWRAWVDSSESGNVYIEAADVEPLVVLIIPGVDTISLTFDQNMNPFISFSIGDQSSFWWYDSLVGTHVTTNLPPGSGVSKVDLDDKRPFSSATSDIILCYVADGNLVFRAQRDRYEIAYLLYADINRSMPNPQVYNVGMNDRNRFQIQLRGTLFNYDN